MSSMGSNRESREEVIPSIQARVDRREIELPEQALKCLCFEQELGWSLPEVSPSHIFPVILTFKTLLYHISLCCSSVSYS